MSAAVPCGLFLTTAGGLTAMLLSPVLMCLRLERRHSLAKGAHSGTFFRSSWKSRTHRGEASSLWRKQILLVCNTYAIATLNESFPLASFSNAFVHTAQVFGMGRSIGETCSFQYKRKQCSFSKESAYNAFFSAVSHEVEDAVGFQYILFFSTKNINIVFQLLAPGRISNSYGCVNDCRVTAASFQIHWFTSSELTINNPFQSVKSYQLQVPTHF